MNLFMFLQPHMTLNHIELINVPFGKEKGRRCRRGSVLNVNKKNLFRYKIFLITLTI